MSIKLEDFQKCCRCCLSTVPPLHPLFGLYLLSDMLNDITSINLHANDGYPQQVCRRCVNKIGTASTFKKMVLKSHQIFKELTKTSYATKETNKSFEIIQSRPEIDNLLQDPRRDEINLKGFSTDHEIDRAKEHLAEENKSLKTNDKKLVASNILRPEDKEQNVNINVSYDTFPVNTDILVNSAPDVRHIFYEDQDITDNEIKRGEDGSNTSPLSSGDVPMQTPTFKCPFCPMRCENNAALKHHLSTHNEICKVCGKSVSRWHKTRHMRTHGEKTFRCEQCGKAFTDRSYYKEHLKTHTNEPTWSRKDCLCCYCGRKYKWKTSLYRHLRLHVGNSHDCEICDKKFTNSYYLKMHLAQHTSPDSKPFACDRCDAKFTRASTLAQHKRVVHSGRREKYSCSHCNKEFLNKKTLRQHETVKHLTETKIYECSECGKQFHSGRSLSLHFRVHKSTQIQEPGNTLTSSENLETLNIDIEKITVVKVEEYTVNSSVLNLL